MYPFEEEYKGIKRQEFPTWGGWKIIDRLRIIYKDYPEGVLDNAIKGDQLLQAYVDDFFGLENMVYGIY
jgi:hypothetical protein